MQVRLLRVLQERRFRASASSKPQADISVVAATHQDLNKLVAEGRFREDLFYRINVIPIRCRRCASGVRTSRCSRSTSSRNTPSRWER